MATNKFFVAVVLIVICLNIDNSKSREITSKREIKFDDICEIKFYSERNFIVEQDNFEKTTAHRRRKTDRSMETLGKQARKNFNEIKFIFLQSNTTQPTQQTNERNRILVIGT